MARQSILQDQQLRAIFEGIERWCAGAPEGTARVLVTGYDQRRGGWFARLDETTTAQGENMADALSQIATFAVLDSEPPGPTTERMT